jgi:hypothetical protein
LSLPILQQQTDCLFQFFGGEQLPLPCLSIPSIFTHRTNRTDPSLSLIAAMKATVKLNILFAVVADFAQQSPADERPKMITVVTGLLKGFRSIVFEINFWSVDLNLRCSIEVN